MGRRKGTNNSRNISPLLWILSTRLVDERPRDARCCVTQRGEICFCQYPFEYVRDRARGTHNTTRIAALSTADARA